MLGRMHPVRVVVGLSLVWACTPSGAPSEPTPAPAAHGPAATAPVSPSVVPRPDRRRVLVTGFNDWLDLGTPPNVWRCRDNPSCRLLLGDAEHARPDRFDGPLPARLAGLMPDVELTYLTLPVTWEIARDAPEYGDQDVVVHLGLGVYDRTDVLLVEDGAYNLRRGQDAAGERRDGPIDPALGEVFAPPPETTRRVRAVDGETLGGYHIEVKAARSDNSYLCNETHFWALREVVQDERLDQAFFVHIPRAADDDYAALAEGVAQTIARLTQ